MISNALACFHNRYEITAAARALQALFQKRANAV
jgi:hypothetical protein